MDAAMERERLLALEKEKAKEEAKKRYVFWKKCHGRKSVSQTLSAKAMLKWHNDINLYQQCTLLWLEIGHCCS